MELTKKQKASNVATSMIRTLTEIADEDKRILEKGTNNRGAFLGAPADIKAAFGTEQLEALEDFITRFATEEEKPETAEPAVAPLEDAAAAADRVEE